MAYLSDFWSNFLSEFLASVIGVGLGVPVALWLNRKITISRQREEAYKVLSALRDEINHNIALLKQMQKELPSAVIFYNLDLSTWEASSRRLGSIPNYELVRHISRIYYEYQHLSRKIDIQFHMHYSILLAMSNYPQIRKSIVDPILIHASVLEKESQGILEEIETELSKLKKH